MGYLFSQLPTYNNLFMQVHITVQTTDSRALVLLLLLLLLHYVPRTASSCATHVLNYRQREESAGEHVNCYTNRNGYFLQKIIAIMKSSRKALIEGYFRELLECSSPSLSS